MTPASAATKPKRETTASPTQEARHATHLIEARVEDTLIWVKG
jgi:hypothetical protein